MELLVLAMLSEGRAHGYMIAREINRRTNGLLVMKEGTLYPLLHRLEREGWLRAAWRKSEQGPPRRTYELTAKGRREASRRARDWRRVSGAVNAVLGETGSG
jgi:transcriptional regulator